MNTYIILGEVPFEHTGASFDENAPQVERLEAQFKKLFAAYKPSRADIPGTYGFPAYGMHVEQEDAGFGKLVKQLDVLAKQSKPSCAVALRQFPTYQEALRAHFIQPKYYSFQVDDGADNKSMMLCDECSFPKLKSIPKPFLVTKAALKKYEIFHAEASVVIVRPRVLKLFQDAIPGQFTHGDVAVAKTKTTGDDRLFWVRPNAYIGNCIRIIEGKQNCPRCNQETLRWVGSMDRQINHVGPGVFDDRLRCTSYEKQNCDFALLNDLAVGRWPAVVMSGALLGHLEANKVTGLLPLKKDTEIACVFSQAGELPLEASPRSLGTTEVSAAKATAERTSLEAARKRAALLKDLPWDFDTDGHIYFHLSTPEFVVMDPMTGEEDDGGPYKVKNYKKPGVYKLPVSAIQEADGRGVAVDSGTLAFVDNAFLASWIDSYEWKQARTKKALIDVAYHQKVAEEIGSRFGICTPPPRKFKSAFRGDGFYKVDASKLSFVSS